MRSAMGAACQLAGRVLPLYLHFNQKSNDDNDDVHLICKFQENLIKTKRDITVYSVK